MQKLVPTVIPAPVKIISPTVAKENMWKFSLKAVEFNTNYAYYS